MNAEMETLRERDRLVAQLYWTEHEQGAMEDGLLLERLGNASDTELRAWAERTRIAAPNAWGKGVRLSAERWPVYCCYCNRIVHVDCAVFGSTGMCEPCAQAALAQTRKRLAHAAQERDTMEIPL